MKQIYIYLLLLFPLLTLAQKQNNQIDITKKEVTLADSIVNIQLTINLSKVHLKSSDVIVLTPEVSNGSNTKALSQIILLGKKRDKLYKRTNSLHLSQLHTTPPQIVTTINPQSPQLKYSITIPYEEWLHSASLSLRQELCQCPGETKLTNLELLTEKLIQESPKEEEATLFLAFLEPQKEILKERSEYGEAYLNFVVGKSDILYYYKDNSRKLDQVRAFFERAQADKDITINSINIIGYASPEGSIQHNLNLSMRRSIAFTKWLQTRFNFPQKIYKTDWVGEDWNKLRTLVEESDMTEKHRILYIIDRYNIFDGRETRLMRLSGGLPYKFMLTHYFPQLRRTYYRIDYTVRPFSPEESKQIVKDNPDRLSIFEFYEAANTYERGSKEFNETMLKAAKTFPKDPVAQNNAAAIALQEGRLDEAERLLYETPHSAAKQNNLGVLYMLQGKYDDAEPAFNDALKLGFNDAQHNLAILQRQQAVNQKKKEQEKEQQRQKNKTVLYKIK